MERTDTTKHGVTLTLNKPLTDEAHIAALETQLGRSLPGDYREFMLRYNGGRPKPPMFRFALRNGRQDNSCVHWFLSIHDGEYSNLERTIRSLQGRIPPDTLPIADDPFGNVVLLGLHSDRRGKVYFWDHENEPKRQPDWSNVALVAETFDGFMRALEAKPAP
jgi:cell wall assembly regulator SMI1